MSEQTQQDEIDALTERVQILEDKLTGLAATVQASTIVSPPEESVDEGS